MNTLFTLLLTLITFLGTSFSTFADPDPDSIRLAKRLSLAVEEFYAIQAQNAWNDANGLSENNVYIFGMGTFLANPEEAYLTFAGGSKDLLIELELLSTESIKAVNDSLVAYNNKLPNGYEIWVYCSGLQVPAPMVMSDSLKNAKTLTRIPVEGFEDAQAYIDALKDEALKEFSLEEAGKFEKLVWSAVGEKIDLDDSKFIYFQSNFIDSKAGNNGIIPEYKTFMGILPVGDVDFGNTRYKNIHASIYEKIPNEYSHVEKLLFARPESMCQWIIKSTQEAEIDNFSKLTEEQLQNLNLEERNNISEIILNSTRLSNQEKDNYILKVFETMPDTQMEQLLKLYFQWEFESLEQALDGQDLLQMNYDIYHNNFGFAGGIVVAEKAVEVGISIGIIVGLIDYAIQQRQAEQSVAAIKLGTLAGEGLRKILLSEKNEWIVWKVFEEYWIHQFGYPYDWEGMGFPERIDYIEDILMYGDLDPERRNKFAKDLVFLYRLGDHIPFNGRIDDPSYDDDACEVCKDRSREVCLAFQKVYEKAGKTPNNKAAIDKICNRVIPKKIALSIAARLLKSDFSNLLLNEFLKDVLEKNNPNEIGANVHQLNVDLIDSWKMFAEAKVSTRKINIDDLQDLAAILNPQSKDATDSGLDQKYGGTKGAIKRYKELTLELLRAYVHNYNIMPDIYTIEKFIKYQENEWGALYAMEGETIGKAVSIVEGTGEGTATPPGNPEGKVFTHNHPIGDWDKVVAHNFTGSSFSLGDLNVTNKEKRSQTRAVSGRDEKIVYIIKKIDGSNFEYPNMAKEVDKLRKLSDLNPINHSLFDLAGQIYAVIIGYAKELSSGADEEEMQEYLDEELMDIFFGNLNNQVDIQFIKNIAIKLGPIYRDRLDQFGGAGQSEHGFIMGEIYNEILPYILQLNIKYEIE